MHNADCHCVGAAAAAAAIAAAAAAVGAIQSGLTADLWGRPVAPCEITGRSCPQQRVCAQQERRHRFAAVVCPESTSSITGRTSGSAERGGGGRPAAGGPGIQGNRGTATVK